MIIIALLGLTTTILVAWYRFGWKLALGLFCLAILFIIVALVIVSVQPETIRHWPVPVI